MLQPLALRTWAPRGQTPVLRQWDRRDRLSTISALTVAPRWRRFGLYWAQYPHNIRSTEVFVLADRDGDLDKDIDKPERIRNNTIVYRLYRLYVLVSARRFTGEDYPWPGFSTTLPILSEKPLC